MTYGTIAPSGTDKREKARGILEFDNKRRVYLNSKEKAEFDAWVYWKIEDNRHREEPILTRDKAYGKL